MATKRLNVTRVAHLPHRVLTAIAAICLLLPSCFDLALARPVARLARATLDSNATTDPSPDKCIARVYTGVATFFNNPNGGPGACGVPYTDSDFVASVSNDLFVGYGDPNCGVFISVTYNGINITVQALDMCPGCKPTSLDLTPAAWKTLQPNTDIGVLDITWVMLGRKSQ